MTSFRSSEAGLAVTVKQVRMIQGRPRTSDLTFVGVRGKDPKVILGSTGNERARTRAKLAATDKETLGKDELTRPHADARADDEDPATQFEGRNGAGEDASRKGRGEEEGIAAGILRGRARGDREAARLSTAKWSRSTPTAPLHSMPPCLFCAARRGTSSLPRMPRSS